MLLESKRLAEWQQLEQMRQRVVVKALPGQRCLVNGKVCINFSSNDYLGLAQHPAITAAVAEGALHYGVGSGASSVVSGFSLPHQQVEQRFAEWLGVDAALLLSSGYLANFGVMSALFSRDTVVYSDKFCHASLLDGIRLSRAKHRRFQHGNSQHCADLCRQQAPNWLVTESVFSMEGDQAPLHELQALARQYHAGVIVDDAHGIGVLGVEGRGVLSGPIQPDCVILPLGKAFNAMGAVVAGHRMVVETVQQLAPSYRYNTALSPAICCGILAALDLVQQEQWRRQRLHGLINHFVKTAKALALPLASYDQTPIQAIVVGDNAKVLAIQQALWAKGYWLAAIRPPTVPKGTARLRLSLNCHHRREDITRLLHWIAEAISC